MYISVVITTIIMIILVTVLLLLHWLAATFPSMSQAFSIIEMIILISILILIHEAGHFFVAELFKIKVRKFAFGLPFGPTLWSKKFGDVEVLVHAFLFGGYVAFPDDDKELNLPPDSPDRFMNRPIHQRFFVLSAGVTANLIFAFLFVAITAGLWGQMPSGKCDLYVKEIIAEKTESVWQSGMQVGDKIISVNGTKISTPNAINMHGVYSKRRDGKVDKNFVEERYKLLKRLNPAFARDEEILKDIAVKLPKIEHEPSVSLNNDILLGLEVYKDTRVDLSDKQKAIRDSLKNESVHLVSDGTYTLNDIAYAISDNTPAMNIVVERNGQIIQLKPIYPNEKGLIGIVPRIKDLPIETKNFKSIITVSVQYLWTQTKLFGYGWYQLFTGKIPVSNLHGPIAIAKIGGDIINTNGLSFSSLLI